MKHITSFLLAVALLVSSITLMPSNNVKAARNAEQWKSSAIVSPEEGKLIGAGYIDVKWNNDLENVKSYSVYVDGALKKTVAPSGETMKVEFYTTAVKSHNAKITATLDDGTTVTTNTRTFYVTKKGVCVNEKDMGTVVDPVSMNIGWYYNWGYRSFKDMGFKNKKFNNVEFVPMIWGDNPKSIEDRCTYANKKEYKYLLSYNEPDLTWESDQTPTAMINRWRETISYKGSL